MIWRLEVWLRHRAIDLLLDLLCFLLPPGERYTVVIEEVGEDVVARITQGEPR